MVEYRRLNWIDFLRALAIILVVFGHCSRGNHLFFLVTSPVKMPLFFAISAYLFKGSDDMLSFFKGVFWKLVVPWFCLGLIPVIFQVPVKGISFMMEYMISMLKGEVIWFMPCFIIAQIVFFMIRFYVKKTCFLVAGMLLLSITGLLLSYFNIGNIAMFNRALVVQAFFLIGFLFKQYSHFFLNLRKVHFFIGWCLFFSLIVLSEILYPGKSIDVHMNLYYNVPYCFMLIFLGVFLLFISASKMQFHNGFMNFIGQNTLVIYIWHGLILGILLKVCAMLKINLNDIYGSALYKTLFACVICAFLSNWMNKYFPLIVGKKSKTK